VAGFTLSIMTVGWPLASFVAGPRIARNGITTFVRTGGITLLIGSLLIALLASRGAMAAGLGSLVIGIGLGLVNTTTLVAIQASVSWSKRGVATATNMLMRILGQALGAALFGGVLNWQMSSWIRRQNLGDRLSLDSIQDLLGGEGSAGRAVVSPELMPMLRAGLSRSLQLVFWGIAIFALITLVATFRIPELERERVT
jgi:MFS family permease